MNVVNKIQHGLALPHEGDTIPCDDRVSVCAGGLEKIGGHGDIVMLKIKER
jgi:hypothetical protein